MLPSQISALVARKDRFAICSHSSPDGDSIGSQLGLALGLQHLGKTAHIYSADPVPHSYSWLRSSTDIRVEKHIGPEYDALIVLECNGLARTGLAETSGLLTINVDHHPGCPEWADLNWIDPRAAAVGLLVEELLQELDVEISEEIATCLYVAVLTDTGSFQYSNTSASTLEAAARLVRCGASPIRISQNIYRRHPASKLRLLSRALDMMKIGSEGKLAWIALRQTDFVDTGADFDESEGLIDFPLSLAGVRIACLFRETEAGSVKVSLRSKGADDVGAFARSLSGGGHRNAAGFLVSGTLDDVETRIVGELEAVLRSC